MDRRSFLKVAAAMLDAMTEVDPYQKVKEAFAACGLPKMVSDALLRRLRVKYTGALTEVRSLKTGEILDIINKKIHSLGVVLSRR